MLDARATTCAKLDVSLLSSFPSAWAAHDARQAVSRRRRRTICRLPGVEPSHASRDLLLHTWPGRLFIISAALKMSSRCCGSSATCRGSSRSSAAPRRSGSSSRSRFFVWRLFVLMKRRLLWRVRRKLILSYIFIGVVPALLIVVFFLLGGVLIFMNVSAYLFKDGYDATRQLREARDRRRGVGDFARRRERAARSLARTHRNAARLYRGLSFARSRAGRGRQRAAWTGAVGRVGAHAAAPRSASGMGRRATDWTGTIVAADRRDRPAQVELVDPRGRASDRRRTPSRLRRRRPADRRRDDPAAPRRHRRERRRAPRSCVENGGRAA